jgi:glycerate 2-kinase
MPTESRDRGWLIAPDSFKGTFAAIQVAHALAEGVHDAGQHADLCPLGDGGEGTMEVLLAALGGRIVQAPARDPLARTILAKFALLDDGQTAVVETAAASGLQQVSERERDAEAATSAGTGDLILAAVRAGARRILVAVGGSACTDGGIGAVEAIREGGGLGGAALEVLCDTNTPFERAAAVFGPQKGADAEMVQRLSARLASVASELPSDPRGLPRSGCAGGLSGALWACFDASLRSGADAVLDVVDFDRRAAEAGQVITGEGRLDEQSLDGKLISVVARRAAKVGASLDLVVGSVDAGMRDPGAAGLGMIVAAGTLPAIKKAAFSLAMAAKLQVSQLLEHEIRALG